MIFDLLNGVFSTERDKNPKMPCRGLVWCLYGC